MFWQEWKLWLSAATGLDDSSLHALAGMLVLVVVAALFRRVPWSWQAWLGLLVVELGNETYDMLNPASGEDRLSASFHDVWVTMWGPTLLLVATPLIVRLVQWRERGHEAE